jgi:hypothetical protein
VAGEESNFLRQIRKSESFSDMFREQERKWRSDQKEQLKSIVPYLADRSWCFYMYLPADDAKELKRLLDEGAHEKIEQHMIGLAKEYTDGIRQRIQKDWRHRAEILNDAFDAHERGLYSLSIPTMLAQADGVCREIFSALFFTKKGKEQLKRKLADLLTYRSATDVFFELLYGDTALSEDTSMRNAKRKKNPQHGPLNRNGVLHGLDIDYDTQANSFRAIVLLGYLQQMEMFFRVKKKVKQQVEAVFKAHGVSLPSSNL